MRIAVITDTHANLPALEAALVAIETEGVEAIVHTGDAIGLGPFPAEVLDRLLHTPNTRLVMGNHDAWFAFGPPNPRPPWMGKGELTHLRWVHGQLDPALRASVAAWPRVIEEEIAGVPVVFVHYALDGTGRGFAEPLPHPDSATMDLLFAPGRARLLFYGHQHYPSAVTTEIKGRTHYVNPDALGCSAEPVARYVLLEIDKNGSYQLDFRAAPYDPAPLVDAFAQREVPERGLIIKTFMGWVAE